MPVSIDSELSANHRKFKAAAKADSLKVTNSISSQDSIFLSSYRLICVFRGWHEVALASLSEDVVGFFIEAHNDLLTSHVHATNGMWRSALISLRSFMESYLSFIYFKDHPVELAQWKNGEFRIEPKTLRQYCMKHPNLKSRAVVKNAAARLDGEYSKLSGSVHGSKVDFRMTSSSSYPAIATDNVNRLRAWQKLETQVVRTALLIFLGLYFEKLQGAAHPVFRKVMAGGFTLATKQAIKSQLGINL